MRVLAKLRLSCAVLLLVSFPSAIMAEDVCTMRTGSFYVETDCGGIVEWKYLRADCTESGSHVHWIGWRWDTRPSCGTWGEE